MTGFKSDGKRIVIVASNVAYAEELSSQSPGRSKLHFVGGGEKVVEESIDEVWTALARELDHRESYRPPERA